ncbi:hypothetical protein P7C70_g5745, partial [Phenoliferia sp. Uapishka_3]
MDMNGIFIPPEILLKILQICHSSTSLRASYDGRRSTNEVINDLALVNRTFCRMARTIMCEAIEYDSELDQLHSVGNLVSGSDDWKQLVAAARTVRTYSLAGARENNFPWGELERIHPRMKRLKIVGYEAASELSFLPYFSHLESLYLSCGGNSQPRKSLLDRSLRLPLLRHLALWTFYANNFLTILNMPSEAFPALTQLMIIVDVSNFGDSSNNVRQPPLSQMEPSLPTTLTTQITNLTLFYERKRKRDYPELPWKILSLFPSLQHLRIGDFQPEVIETVDIQALCQHLPSSLTSLVLQGELTVQKIKQLEEELELGHFKQLRKLEVGYLMENDCHLEGVRQRCRDTNITLVEDKVAAKNEFPMTVTLWDL